LGAWSVVRGAKPSGGDGTGLVPLPQKTITSTEFVFCVHFEFSASTSNFRQRNFLNRFKETIHRVLRQRQDGKYFHATDAYLMFRAVFLSVGKFLCAVKSLNYFASQIKFRLIVTIFGTSKEKAALSNHPLLFLQPRLQFQCLEIVSLFMDHPCGRDLLFGPSVCRIT